MPDLNEQVVPFGPPGSRLSPGVRRTLWLAAAVIVVLVGTIGVRSMPAGRSFGWVALSMGLITAVGLMLAVAWRNIVATRRPEPAIADLGEAVARAHEAQVRAEGE